MRRNGNEYEDHRKGKISNEISVKMACLPAGTVLSATVEQALENCLLVCVKHRSRIFRGVLFDEKNAFVSRAPSDNQGTSLGAEKDKLIGGSSVADSASRWSSRQASLYYRRQNSKSFPCRKIPSLFSDVKVLTDEDLIKESQRDSENMVGKAIYPTKRPSASCEHKTRQGQFNKTRETSGGKASLSSQVSVKSSKIETSLKRKSSGQVICDRPSKRKPDMVSPVAKLGVQKSRDKKHTKGLCKGTRKPDVDNNGKRSLGSKNSIIKGTASTEHQVLSTRHSSVPVVSTELPTRTAKEELRTGLVFGKVLPCTPMETNCLSPENPLFPLGSNYLADKNVNQKIGEGVNDLENRTTETDLVGRPVQYIRDNEDDNVLERVVTITTENLPKCTTINGERSLATEEETASDVMTPQFGLPIQSKEVYSENKLVMDLSDGADHTKIQEFKTENVVIKRSARISERRAKFTIAQLLPKIERVRSHRNRSSAEDVNLVKVPQSDGHESNTLNDDVSSTEAEREMLDLTCLQNETLKHTSNAKCTNTKYTQRMTWQLHPQVAPADDIDPVAVGDIVWGKVHGHPWWPGKVLAISGIRNEGSQNPWDRDAHVSWFGSNTSSIMHLHALQLFTPNFAKRHKKRKKGFYRVAVRQAQEAAESMADKDKLTSW